MYDYEQKKQQQKGKMFLFSNVYKKKFVLFHPIVSNYQIITNTKVVVSFFSFISNKFCVFQITEIFSMQIKIYIIVCIFFSGLYFYWCVESRVVQQHTKHNTQSKSQTNTNQIVLKAQNKLWLRGGLHRGKITHKQSKVW